MKNVKSGLIASTSNFFRVTKDGINCHKFEFHTLILGDLNVRISKGQLTELRPLAGARPVDQETNSNCEKVLEFCLKHGFKIVNTLL